MPEQPDDMLESLLAAEEAGIRDDGFTAAVMHRVEKQQNVRRFAVYGAGMTGFGIAVGGVTRLGELFPGLSAWAGDLVNSVESAGSVRVSDMLSGGNPGMIAALVAALGVTFFLLATTLQER